jgi:putative ABC transport system permease protein
MTRFGGDRRVIGRVVTFNDEPHEVVGVLPPGFELPKLSHFYALEVELQQPQIWKPFAATERDLRPLGSFSHIALAKVKPGVALAQATDDINAVQQDLARRAPEPAQFRATLVPVADQIVSRSRTALQLVLGAVALVLLIACVNVTNLLLARGGRRQREFAIRRAAGAHRLRLMTQMLIESLVLSTAAGIVGLVVGAGVVRVVHLYAPVDVPRIEEAGIDARVLLFTFAATLLSGLIVGLVPAWRTTRPTGVDLLRSSAAGATPGRAAGRLRSGLVSVEVAASAVCVIAAVLLLSSFVKLLSIERGFEEDRIVTFEFALLEPRYDTDAGVRFLTSLLERVRALPGVRSAGVTDMLPLSGVSGSAITVEGTNLPRGERPSAMIRFADPGYFRTMDIERLSGRLLGERDRQVAVIARRTAERLWPQQDPIGKRFRHGPDDSPWVEVVGVVHDVRAVSLTEEPPLLIYRPMPDYFYGLAALAVETTADPAAVGPAVLGVMRELDPDLVLPTARTMSDIVVESVAPRRFQMNLMIVLAAAAAFLAAVGIYGVVSQAVLQRTSEFGIRMALGAASGAILGLVLRGAMLPVVVGLAIGIVASLSAGRFLRALLFGVSPTDVMPFAVVTLFLVGVALIAAFVPARRAMRVNPMEALRTE